MARSISEFIQEQESVAVNDNNMSDSLEKVYVESMIAFSTAQCVLEHAALVDFASECGISNIAVLQEAGDSTEEKKTNIFKRVGGAMANAWHWFVGVVKAIWKKIIGIFKKSEVDKTAKEFKSIFEQMETKYPEITEETDVGEYMQFLMKTFPNAKTKVNSKDAFLFTKYIDTCNLVSKFNESLQEIYDDNKGINKPELDLTKITSTIDASRNTKYENDKKAASMDTTKDTIKMSMGKLLEAVDRITKDKNTSLEELCKRSNKLLDDIDGLVKKTEAHYAKASKEVEDQAAKNKTMADVFTVSAQSTPAALSTNKDAIEKLRKWVNTMTAQEAELSAGFANIKNLVNELAPEMLRKAQETNDQKVEYESFYFV